MNHKLRLAFVAMGVTGLLLGALFGAIVLISRQTEFHQKESDLESGIKFLTGDPDGHLEMEEFLESHPEMSVNIFNADRLLVRTSGPLRMTPTLGLQKQNGVLSWGMLYYGYRDRRHGPIMDPGRHGEVVVVVGLNWRETESGLKRLAVVLTILWFPLTLLAGLVTWLAARSVFNPLERLTQQAATISGSNLKDRLTTADRAEFGVFATQLNQMLDRIEDTVRRQDQFASDAAHELRTPLAILRTQIETTLLRERTTPEYVTSHEALLREIERVTRIVESLLKTARTLPRSVEPIDIEPVVREALERWGAPFRERSISLIGHTAPARAAIGEEEVSVVLDNLLDNALRFAPSESAVRVTLERQGDQVVLSVKDEGPGVPPELGDRIFERLVRGDDSRNRASGGVGIGLAVCRRVMESRGGRIGLRNPGEPGATIVCQLPAA